jgi:tripartite-type tricarboxylate transporter receptor subunit TctC
MKRSLAMTALALALAPAAFAQWQPTRPIRMVVGFAPGGTADIMARILAPVLTERFQQTVVVDNRPGAGSSIGSDITAKSPADGQTVSMISGSHAINAGLYAKLPYDSAKDFAGVSRVADTPCVLVVYSGLAAKSVPELIALARAKPGQLNYGSSGIGGSSHLAGELFKTMAKVDMTHVPYKGASPALTDLISGQVQLLMPALPSALAQIKAGRVRALGVTSLKRSATLPDLPTVAESGLPGFEVTNWYMVLAPARTPKPVVDAWNAATIQALRTQEVKEAIERQGAEPAPSTPAEADRYLRSEITKWAGVIRKAGLRPE